MKQNHPQGFIMILCLGITMLALALVTMLVTKSRVFRPFVKTNLRYDNAQRLALSGVHIGMAQLSLPFVAEKQGKEAAKKDEKKEEELLLPLLITKTPQWQKFSCTKTPDGFDADMWVSISSEEGKINLHALCDSSTGELRKDLAQRNEWDKVLTLLATNIEKRKGIKEFRKELTNFLKQKKAPLDDISELLTHKAFQSFKNDLFYDPSYEKTDDKKQAPLYLMDIFTLWPEKSELNPWLLTPSVASLVGLEKVDEKKAEEKIFTKEELAKIAPPFSWPKDWDTYLKKVYNKESKALPPELFKICSTKFEPEFFTIISQAKVAGVTCKVAAIVQRTENKEEEKPYIEVIIRKNLPPLDDFS